VRSSVDDDEILVDVDRDTLRSVHVCSDHLGKQRWYTGPIPSGVLDYSIVTLVRNNQVELAVKAASAMLVSSMTVFVLYYYGKTTSNSTVRNIETNNNRDPNYGLINT